MESRYDYFLRRLREKNIHLSYQRLKILERLCQTLDHPAAEQIYGDLQPNIPTLSKTTVYNTLNFLVEAGLLRIVSLEDNKTRYDIVTKNHGHFKCRICGKVHDFSIDIEAFFSPDLEGFEITDKDVYFKGTCQVCLCNINNKK